MTFLDGLSRLECTVSIRYVSANLISSANSEKSMSFCVSTGTPRSYPTCCARPASWVRMSAAAASRRMHVHRNSARSYSMPVVSFSTEAMAFLILASKIPKSGPETGKNSPRSLAMSHLSNLRWSSAKNAVRGSAAFSNAGRSRARVPRSRPLNAAVSRTTLGAIPDAQSMSVRSPGHFFCED